MQKHRVISFVCLLVALLAGSFGSVSQSAPLALSHQQLFDVLAVQDRDLFNAVMGAYGKCDLQKASAFFSEDVEFYHDQGGLTRTRPALLEQIKTVCGKQRRELVKGSLEVFPVPGYGAIQLGAHRFYHPTPNGGEEGGTVTARFLHVWQFQDGTWKITRVMSYAH